MYTFLCDGQPFYSPYLINEGYGVISPKLTLELNKAGSFSFVLPTSNVMYDRMSKLKSVITVEKDGTEIFRGRILHDSKDYYKRKTVYCEGELAYLNDSVQRPYTFSGSVSELFTKYLNNHNSSVEEGKRFKVGTVSITDKDVDEQYTKDAYILLTSQPADWTVNFTNYYRKSGTSYISVVGTNAPKFMTNTFYRYDGEELARRTKTDKNNTEYAKTIDEFNTKLIEEFGGYLKIRYSEGERYLDYLDRYGHNSGQTIIFAENLLNIEEYITAENVITCLIPYGAEYKGSKTLITSVNNNKDYIENETAISLFGRIWGYEQWQDVDNPSKLLIKAQEFLANNISMSVSLKVSAVDLSLVDVDVEALNLGDSVRVVSVPHGLDAFFLLSSMTLDLVEADKSTYTLGYAFNALTDQQVADKKALEKSFILSKKLANLAQFAADDAQDSADRAQSSADNAQERADDAWDYADDAWDKADSAQTLAGTAQGTANSAYNRATDRTNQIVKELKDAGIITIIFND